MIKLYGIPNCDTVAKSRRWLTANDVDFEFHDFKKQGLDEKTVKAWLKHIDWSLLVNKRGTTYRKLSDAQKAQIEDQNIALLIEQPSLIKRPVWQLKQQVLVGFKEDVQKTLESEI